MWIFLSARLRRWLLIAIALPVLRRLVHFVAERLTRRNPHAWSTQLTRRADSRLAARPTRGGRRAANPSDAPS